VARLTALRESGVSRSKLEVVFNCVEELAASAHGDVKELVTLTVIEPLIESSDLLRAAWPYLGRVTRNLVRAVAQASGQNHNPPDFPG
jgi:hypothetical protein